MNKPALAPIPVFKLYGESLGWPTPDLLHCEPISQRSREHHWEIKPHRHADLCQLLFISRGQAQLQVEGQQRLLDEPLVQVLPPLSVHGFRFSEDIEGFVVTLAAPLVSHLQAQLGASASALAKSGSYPAGEDAHYLNVQFAALQNEYQGRQPAREMLMHALVSTIVVWVGRRALQCSSASQRPQRAREYFNGFIQLVEAHYREHLKVEDMAQKLGISVSHLNGTCRELAGQPALQIIHQRQLLEAKRLLTYTGMTIYEISDELGFSDPTNFTRLFRRREGISPKVFRDRLKADQAADGVASPLT
ncbi:helix-turn-helix domain-containing protein [Pseudomonas chlororaphis]|uniref:helix-turn-helix domain-containing protein n=1 Tax=Pseudomonas chlororaphis TaxID=587753 RepID=UPI00209B2C04|nr:helix-turn-helix domain-containing protein [Pseudomonas chlororaphis]MCO7613079.1 helix-turn-helix domain-containing protein [Pseudomonas chlororaphis]